MNVSRLKQIIKETFAVIWLLLALLPISSAVYSKGEHTHGAHVHGEAILNIVLETQSVVVELRSPAVNIVGFEHQASTAEQRNAVTHAMQLLEEHSNVVAFTTGVCRQTSVDIGAPYIDDDKHDQDDDHYGHTHDHEENASVTEEHDSHSEFHVVYHLMCDELDEIAMIDISVFEHFQGFDSVRVQWVGANGQGMAKASKAKNQVTLKP